MKRAQRFGWALAAAMHMVQPTNATTYYVDARDGQDQFAGTSGSYPWRSIRRVNEHDFEVGDVVLFRRGQTWYDASIQVRSQDLTLGAYGDGPMPRLIGAIEARGWQPANHGLYWLKHRHDWDVQLVVQNERVFYRKIETAASDLKPGTFYFDKVRGRLYIRPADGKDPHGKPFLVGSRNHVIELQDRAGINLTVEDLEISFSNRFGVSPWWQGGQVAFGSVAVKNCRFVGNAYSAVALSGAASYERVVLSNNTIEQNGAEGIYIGIKAVRAALLIADNTIGSVTDDSFGWRGEGAGSAFNGDGIDIKWGNVGVHVRGNTVTRVRGYHGIAANSAGSVVENNVVRDVYLPGAENVAGISTDVQENGAPVLIVGNRVEGAKSHGIALYGNSKTQPPVVVRHNSIELPAAGGYAQIALPSANNANMTIEGNAGYGGTYGLYVAGLPPMNLSVSENLFARSKQLFYFGPKVLAGMTMRRNRICYESEPIVRWGDERLTTGARAVRDRLGDDSVVQVDCRRIASTIEIEP